jgi:glyoxylase-like metal-dependent hydrolase (beta-lactamase superfamily II)
MNIQATVIPVTPFQQNCTLLSCINTKKAAIFDPGGDIDVIAAQLEKDHVTPEVIFVTHGHLDHCAQARMLADQLSVPVIGPHKGDDYWIEQLPEQSTMLGIPAVDPWQPDQWLEDGDVVSFGDQKLEVIHCPGHTPGHVIFFHRGENLAIVGDVLFQGSIGRTDFPGGNHEQLITAIKTKLFPLGDDVTFIPGHGPASTFGQERQTNPFVGSLQFR